MSEMNSDYHPPDPLRQVPNDTGLLVERHDDGDIVFEIDSPSLRALMPRALAGAAVPLVGWALASVSGLIAWDATLALMAVTAALIVGGSATMDYYGYSRRRVRMRLSEERLLVEISMGGIWEAAQGHFGHAPPVLVAEQPYEFGCRNLWWASNSELWLITRASHPRLLKAKARSVVWRSWYFGAA